MKSMSIADHRRICRQLLLRYRRRGDKGVVAVGMGRGLKNREPDPERPFVIHFFVRRKRKLHARHPHFIPPRIRYSLTRGGRRKQYAMTTDVIAIGQPTVSGVKIDSITQWFTAGYVLRWTIAGQINWGLLAVGHGIDSGASAVTVAGLSGPRTVVGQTALTDAIDASVIGVSTADLAVLSAVSFGPDTPALPYLTEADALNQIQGLSAFLDSTGGNIAINIVSITGATFPGSPTILELPNLQHMMYATAGTNAFAKGASGSPWISDGPPAVALQTGGCAPNYAAGYGQLMGPILQWAAVAVSAPVTMVGWV